MDKKIIVYLSFEIFTAGVTEWRVKLNIDLVDFDKYWPLSLSVPSSCLSRLSNWDCIDLRWSFKVSEILSWLESKGTHLRPRNKMRMTRDDMTIWVSRVSRVLFRVKRIQIVKWSGRVGFPCFQDILLLFTVFDKLDLHGSECAVPSANLIGSTLVIPTEFSNKTVIHLWNRYFPYELWLNFSDSHMLLPVCDMWANQSFSSWNLELWHVPIQFLIFLVL